jgi:hypothetical protein
LKGTLPIDKLIGNWIAAGLAIFLSIAALILAYDAIKALTRPLKLTKPAPA